MRFLVACAIAGVVAFAHRGDQHCQTICDAVSGCKSKGSYCKGWQSAPVCYGLYWRDASRKTPCYFPTDSTCSERYPVICDDKSTHAPTTHRRHTTHAPTTHRRHTTHAPTTHRRHTTHAPTTHRRHTTHAPTTHRRHTTHAPTTHRRHTTHAPTTHRRHTTHAPTTHRRHTTHAPTTHRHHTTHPPTKRPSGRYHGIAMSVYPLTITVQGNTAAIECDLGTRKPRTADGPVIFSGSKMSFDCNSLPADHRIHTLIPRVPCTDYVATWDPAADTLTMNVFNERVVATRQ